MAFGFAQSTIVSIIISLVVAGVSGIIVSKFLAKKPALDPKEYQKFKLIAKTAVSPNTAIYRFALPNSDDRLGLPIGQHISVAAEINGKQISRSYTPISSNGDLGFFELLIKSYPTGNISKLFGEMNVGDFIDVRGPKGQFVYKANMVRAFGMIAGGTGITPMLQIIRAVLKNPRDRTKIGLIFANVNKEDILLIEEIDKLAAKHNNFKVHYVLNNPPDDWKGGVGFVTADMIKEYCPAYAEDAKILLCGPPPMISAMTKAVVDLGWPKPRAISKLEDAIFKF
jgi:cytochrome-b5 reductase